jgi:DNA polymerase-3 subunit gamma/tau
LNDQARAAELFRPRTTECGCPDTQGAGVTTKSKGQDATTGGGGYTVLARRYRSRDFDEVVGQEPIARTLRNAITHNRTAHAYLFCGTRGVGKTSMARIFAKALNVTEDLAEQDAIRDSILRGEDLDVIEIDGASNRGIQEAKDLIAGAGLSPARCPYKIYIIDEVHMLTREAFNALLKTMEEPPSHVKFILCTTDPHKVPSTIQSRCQRFDFRAIPSPLIAQHLSYIINEEGIKADDAVVAQIARFGNGSMRDALSLLDRLLAAGEGTLTTELLDQMLGLPDQALVSELVTAIASGDVADALQRGAQFLAAGATVEQALDMLTERFRILLVVAACGADADLLDLPSDDRAAAAEQATSFDPAGLVHMIALCDATSRNARGSVTARALFDALIARLCLAEHLADIGALLDGAAEDGGGKKKEKAGDAEGAGNLSVARRSARPHVAPGGVTEVKPDNIIRSATPVSDAEFWPRVLELAAQNPRDQAMVQNLDCQSFDGQTLRVAVTEAGARIARVIGSRTETLADLVQRATGRRVRIVIDTSRLDDRSTSGPVDDDLDEVRQRPLVRQAMDLFDATVVGVEERQGMTDDQRDPTD